METTEKKVTQDYAGRLAAAECFAKYGWWPHIVRLTPEDEGALRAASDDVGAMRRAYEECAAQHAHPATAHLALGRLFAQRLAAYPMADVADALRCVLENWQDAREAAGRTTTIGEGPNDAPPDNDVWEPPDLGTAP